MEGPSVKARRVQLVLGVDLVGPNEPCHPVRVPLQGPDLADGGEARLERPPPVYVKFPYSLSMLYEGQALRDKSEVQPSLKPREFNCRIEQYEGN